MATRVPPSERLCRELDEKLVDIDCCEDPIEEVARLGARLTIQQAMDDEVSEFLGRGRYERTGDPVAYRNGYESTTVATTSARWSSSVRDFATPRSSATSRRSSARA